MKQAILSDIHGNLEALTSVLADARDQRVDRIICLGD
ncbi:MAG: metallophosphoesterase family protein, partial [Pirellulaceae bacterium]